MKKYLMCEKQWLFIIWLITLEVCGNSLESLLILRLCKSKVISVNLIL